MHNRPYYADYTNHMLRFYCKNPTMTSSDMFKNSCDERNWRACHKVVTRLTPKERDIITMLYSAPGANLSDNVRLYALNHRMTESSVWNVIHDVSLRVARMRGLL